MGLIYLDGGPLHGSAYDTRDLLGAPEAALPHGYVWTSERKTSPRTGKTAQVWRYAGDLLTDLPPQQSPSAGTAPPVPDHTPPPPADLPSSPNGDVVGPAPADPPLAAALDDAAVNEGGYLRQRRKALKVSAGKLAERAGLKSSRVYAIETNTGKPVTDEERASLLPALDALEAEASAH